ncbi:MAG: hypothetical protein Satyrvirus11_8 [Satyrvirus sp.]|uniref:Uncharacterized protein n=1 Tax=Satyrvirus sp. TaxID=2487771 RepID=A0A3G5ADN3_9VIRU|nr:MAG: hypothetical protein Satyrvirus11_8 [Satyrvirus sp.]
MKTIIVQKPKSLDEVSGHERFIVQKPKTTKTTKKRNNINKIIILLIKEET